MNRKREREREREREGERDNKIYKPWDHMLKSGVFYAIVFVE